MQVFTQKSIITIPLSVLKVFIETATQIQEEDFLLTMKYHDRQFEMRRDTHVEGIVTIDGVPLRDEAFEDIIKRVENASPGERMLVTASGVYYAITIHPTLKDVVINIGRA